MTDVAWMYGKHSLPNTQPQNQIISLSFSPALNPWAGLGAGDRVSPCLAGDVEGRMKSSQLASKSQDKGKEEREEVCIPSFLSQTQHFKQRHFFSEGMKNEIISFEWGSTLDRTNFWISPVTISPREWFRHKIWERKRKDSTFPHVVQKAIDACITDWKRREKQYIEQNWLIKENMQCASASWI